MTDWPLVTGDTDFDRYFWGQFVEGLREAFTGGVPAQDAAGMFLDNFGTWSEPVAARMSGELTNECIDQILGFDPARPSTFAPTREWHQFLDHFRRALARAMDQSFQERLVATRGFLLPYLAPKELN